jgi:hypothetical protein
MSVNKHSETIYNAQALCREFGEQFCLVESFFNVHRGP